MMTSQQQADWLLTRWQSYRGDTSLTPEERIELAFLDFLLPPQISLAEYDLQMGRVAEALREPA